MSKAFSCEVHYHIRGSLCKTYHHQSNLNLCEDIHVLHIGVAYILTKNIPVYIVFMHYLDRNFHTVILGMKMFN